MNSMEKKYLSLLLAVLMVFSVVTQLTFADETETEAKTVYEAGVTVEADSDSPTGYYAIFVYKDTEAAKVEIDSKTLYFQKEGDSTNYTPHEWEIGMFPLDKGTYREDLISDGNGTWTLKLPLPSGAFSYRYRVTDANGEISFTIDPANEPLVNTATGLVSYYSMVYMPFDSTKQVTDYSVELPRTDGKTGTVEFITYMDGTTERPLAIYLPYGFDANREEPYKVLYLSHGSGGHELDWMNDGAVPNIMDNMIAEDRTEPFIVVTMNNQEYSWNYTEIMRNQFELIISLLENNYNASTDSADRAYAGLSAGSGVTMQMYTNHPTEFGYFGMFSGGSMRNYFDIEGVDLKSPRLFIGIGNQDTTRIADNLTFLETLDGLGVNYDYYATNGAHDWKLWPKLYVNFLENVLWSDSGEFEAGVTLTKDTRSPTGYMAHFVYENATATEVGVQAKFRFYKEGDYLTTYTPWEWTNDMFPVDMHNRGYYADDGSILRKDGYYRQPMEKIAETDLWTTYFPIPSGAYHYTYGVDGVSITDPANPPLTNPASIGVSSSANLSVFYGAFDASKQSVDLSNWYPAEMNGITETGSISFVKYTDYAGDQADLGIYLPYGYDANRTEPYKVLYLSHGGGGTEIDWFAYGYAGNVLDNLIATDQCGEFIIVTMNNARYNFGLTYNTEGESIGVENIIQCIIPYVESSYNVITEPSGRALSGLSMGGKFTTRVHYAYPTMFGYYAMQSVAAEDVADKLLNVGVPEGFDEASLWLGAGCYDFGWNWIYDVTKNPATGGDGGSLTIYYNALKELGLYDGEIEFVHGSHDWFTWPAILEILATDFLWANEPASSAWKQVLLDTINEAEALIGSDEYNNTFDFIRNYFNKSLSKAKAVYNNPAATEGEVMDAWMTLVDSIGYFAAVPADMAKLSILVDLAKGLDLRKYNVGVEAFNTALANAESVLEDMFATQDEVDSAYTALLKAITAMRYTVNKDLLQALYNQVSGIGTSMYTADSVLFFANALSSAETVLADEYATQEEVDASYDDLYNAFKGLTLSINDTSPDASASDPSSSEGSSEDGDNSTARTATSDTNTAGASSTASAASAPKTGENSPLIGIITVIGLAGLMIIISKKRKSI